MEKNFAERKPYQKGFHPIYLWGGIYVLCTYLYPVLAVLLDRDGFFWKELRLLLIGIPFFLLAANIVIAVKTCRTLDGRYFLNTALLIKYALIPFYLLGACLVLACALLTIIPPGLFLVVGPVAAVILLIWGWVSMAGSAPFALAYLWTHPKEKTGDRVFAAVIGIMQFFFGLDVIGVMIAALREKRFVKLTIGVLFLLFLLTAGGVLLLLRNI